MILLFSSLKYNLQEIDVRKILKIAIPSTMITLNITLAATTAFTLSPILAIPTVMLAYNLGRNFMVQDSPLEVFMPLIIITSQREILAYHGIVIDNFYNISRSE